MESWIKIEENSDFPLENIPFGIGNIPGSGPRICTRIGDNVIDLAALARLGYFDDLGLKEKDFIQTVLNSFIALGKSLTCKVRSRIQECFSLAEKAVNDFPVFHETACFSAETTEMLMPLRVGDYTDFYSSIEHATNVGIMFRDPANALLPNWRHLPVAYHGRSSSIVVSGTGIHRPIGQTKPAGSESPVFGSSKQLDFELETAFVIGKQTRLGERVDVSQAENYIFGLLLFNDLSARDIQSWEYVPLGPFLSKNFASVISPWVVTLDALEPFRTAGPKQDPEVLEYLKTEGDRNFDISLEVLLQAPGKQEETICRSNFKYMYWNICQQLAHHTVSGCNIRVGDLCASGTISGPDPGSYGSMLELSWRGTKPILLADGSERSFLNDSDTVILRGYCRKGSLRIGFGEVRTTILPAV